MSKNDAPVLRQSVRWGEEYTSRALNIKFAGIFKTGVYHGFSVKQAGPMSVLVDHGDDPYGRSVAVVERDGYSLTVIMDGSGIVEIPAPGTWFVCIEAFYAPTQQGYQRIVIRDAPEPHHIVLAKLVVDNPEFSDPVFQISTEEKMEPELDVKALRQIAEIRAEVANALSKAEAAHCADIRLAANIIQMSDRLTKLELARLDGASFATPAQVSQLGPEGYRLGDAVIAPVTILPDGAEAPPGAACVMKLEDILPTNQ